MFEEKGWINRIRNNGTRIICQTQTDVFLIASNFFESKTKDKLYNSVSFNCLLTRENCHFDFISLKMALGK